MFADLPYDDINQVMRFMNVQIYEGVPFCYEFANTTNAKDLYNLFNTLFKYKNDPPNIELIMSPETFANNNYWGIDFAGDCDDFVTFITSYCISLEIKCEIVLAGRSKKSPVHIYNYVEYNGKMIPFDITNRLFNYEREGYKYKQFLKVN